MLVFRLGWRNLWRNPRRSVLTSGAVAVAFGVLIILLGLVEGMGRQSALMDVMENLNHEHQTTFVFFTHDPRIMERAGRVIRLLDGSVETDEPRSASPS